MRKVLEVRTSNFELRTSNVEVKKDIKVRVFTSTFDVRRSTFDVRFSCSLLATRLACVALLAIFASGLRGQDRAATLPAATAPASASVDDLIKQLGSDSADDRDAAQKQLVDLGQPAVAGLKKAAEGNDDPEVRSRAAAALAQMKDQDFNGPSLITAHLKDAAVQDVLSTIGAQAHTTFIGFGGMLIPGRANPTLSLDADRKPFWDVMSDVCGQLHVCPAIDTAGTRNGLRLFPSARNWIADSPHEIVGPFWINVAGVYRTRSIDLQGTPLTDEAFSVRLNVVPEPKLSVGQMSDLVLKEATDDAGHSLMPAPRAMGAAFIGRGNSSATHLLECRLTYPENPGKKIAILRGEITADLAQDVKRYQADNVLGTPTVSNPLVGCTVASNVVHQGTEMYRVTIQCTRTGMGNDQWTAMMNHAANIALEDADGHSLTGFQTTMSMNNVGGSAASSFTATTLFSRSNFVAMIGAARQVTKTGEARRLTWNVATSVKPVVIPVLFKDLPMP